MLFIISLEIYPIELLTYTNHKIMASDDNYISILSEDEESRYSSDENTPVPLARKKRGNNYYC